MLVIDTAIEHPRRRALNDEVHARPPDSLATPGEALYLVRMPSRSPQSPDSVQMLGDLLRRYDAAIPEPGTTHLATALDSLRLRWERHTEYNRYTFVASNGDSEPFGAKIGDEALADWLESMRGEVLVGVRVSIIAMSGRSDIDPDAISNELFSGNVLIGSHIADDNATAFTDLRIHDDGFSRLLLINRGMSEAQTGRVLQRLLEIETYRMLTLLALPIAQQLMPVLDDDERELAAVGEALVRAEPRQEQPLLDRLTRLSAESQSRHQRTNYRFSAADAYYEIVLQRISDLRETRIPGLQTFEEFTTRRLSPAVKTYRAVSKRQQSVLEQMARATKLLSTRIDIARQLQQQSLLASMNRRVKTQLRLQATVEGLSVAAVTYYVVGLVGTLAEGLQASTGLGIDKSVVMGASIPVVAAIAFFGIRRLRKKISREQGD